MEVPKILKRSDMLQEEMIILAESRRMTNCYKNVQKHTFPFGEEVGS